MNLLFPMFGFYVSHRKLTFPHAWFAPIIPFSLIHCCCYCCVVACNKQWPTNAVWYTLRGEHDLRWWQWWRSRSLAGWLAGWLAQPLQCYHDWCCCFCNCSFRFIFFLFRFFCAGFLPAVSNLRTDSAQMNESKSRFLFFILFRWIFSFHAFFSWNISI